MSFSTKMNRLVSLQSFIRAKKVSKHEGRQWCSAHTFTCRSRNLPIIVCISVNFRELGGLAENRGQPLLHLGNVSSESGSTQDSQPEWPLECLRHWVSGWAGALCCSYPVSGHQNNVQGHLEFNRVPMLEFRSWGHPLPTVQTRSPSTTFRW